MFPKILNIYGPIAINSYGTMIAIGFLLFTYLTYRHPQRKKLISGPDFFDSLFFGLLSGIIGGRILFILENTQAFRDNWLEAFYPWAGGFSILGTLITILITVPIYLKIKKVPILPFLDLISIHAPLLQSIARIGCFLAGCCYGKTACSDFALAIFYKNPECLAPLGCPLHPTQLYSSFASFIIFLLILLISKKAKKPGLIAFSYLFLEGIARFVVDFWRGDRSFINLPFLPQLNGIISFYQFFALLLSIFSIFAILRVIINNKD